MCKNVLFRAALVAISLVVTACGSVPGKTVQAPAPQPAVTDASLRKVNDLSRTLSNLIADAKRRDESEREAWHISKEFVAKQSLPTIAMCFEIPDVLKKSQFYEEFAQGMSVYFAAACLFEVKRLEDQRLKNRPPTPKKK